MVVSQKWRTSREYRLWRIQIIRRDKKCVLCNSTKRRSAHHLKSASYFPEARYDVDNGVTLCTECHINFHCNYKRSFRQKCDIDDWNNFISLTNYLSTKDSINLITG